MKLNLNRMSGNYRRLRQRAPVNANFLKNYVFAKISLLLVQNWEIIVEAEKVGKLFQNSSFTATKVENVMRYRPKEYNRRITFVFTLHTTPIKILGS